MALPKKKYKVYRQTVTENDAGVSKSGWEFMGDTWAPSEAKAINNVVHRTGGVHPGWVSDFGGIMSYWYEWKGVCVSVNRNK